MIDSSDKLSQNGAARELLLSRQGLVRDAETRMAVDLQAGYDGKEATARVVGVAPRGESRLRRIAAEILRSVEARLPGRVRDLKVRFEGDHFVLSGVSSSYYVKQVAQHVAMTALDAVMLGRLVNEIEVRSVR